MPELQENAWFSSLTIQALARGGSLNETGRCSDAYTIIIDINVSLCYDSLSQALFFSNSNSIILECSNLPTPTANTPILNLNPNPTHVAIPNAIHTCTQTLIPIANPTPTPSPTPTPLHMSTTNPIPTPSPTHLPAGIRMATPNPMPGATPTQTPPPHSQCFSYSYSDSDAYSYTSSYS